MKDCSEVTICEYAKTSFNNQINLYVSMWTDIDLGTHDYPVLGTQIPKGFARVFERIKDATSPTAIWFSYAEVESYKLGSFQFLVEQYPLELYFDMLVREVDDYNEETKDVYSLLCWQHFYS